MPKSSPRSSKKSADGTDVPGEIPRGTTSLGDFRERFLERATELAANARVKVLWNYVGEPTSRETVVRATEAAGLQLSPAEIEFYTRSNGLALVWVPVNAPEFDPKLHKPKKGLPAIRALESLSTEAFRMIVMPPIEKVVEPLFDYGKALDDDTPRLGFDFTGGFTTPALVVRDGNTVVMVGDDSGADWTSSRETSLEDYLETVLATWGDVPLRRTIYLAKKRGIGRAYFETNPVPLASLLPPPPPPTAKEEMALVRTLSRVSPSDMTDELLLEAARALRSKNEKLLRVASRCLLDSNRERAAAHVGDVVAALEQRATDPSWDRHSADAYRPHSLADILHHINVPLGLADAERVLRHGETSWAVRARAARHSGDALLETISRLLDEPGVDQLSAVGAAALLGPVAAPLLPRLEALLDSKEECQRVEVSLAAAVAVVAIEPARAEELEARLLRAIGSPFVRDLLNTEDEAPVWTSFLERLPASSQTKIARALLELDDLLSHLHVLGLLTGLGSAGIDAAFGFVDTHIDADVDSKPGRLMTFLLCIVLPQCALSIDERSRLVATSKRVLLAVHQQKGFWYPDYLASLLVVGGRESLAPEVGPEQVGYLEPSNFSAESIFLRRALERLRVGAP